MLKAEMIKAWASDAGFCKCGIARADTLEIAQQQFEEALQEGRQADMHFLERDVNKRFNPALLLPDCQTVIVVALNYLIDEVPQSDRYRTARYTWIEDYHQIVKERLDGMVQHILTVCPEVHCRTTVDSACISEKRWAERAGVGCLGKNGLIHNEYGSFFVLGTLLADTKVDCYDEPAENDCGECQICLESCPAKAIEQPFQVDARKCYSYHTIENKNPDNEILRSAPLIFGCDVCQEVCPKNKKIVAQLPKVLKSSVFLRLQNDEVENLSKEAFKTFFGKTAIARRKYERVMRAVAEKRKADIQE